MRFPFVTRARFDDAQETIRQLRDEKDGLQHEVRMLHNNIEWRATGVQTYPEMEVLPERIRNQVAAVAEPVKEEVDDSQLSMTDRAIRATGSRNPRTIANWISKHNVLEFQRANFGKPASEIPTREGRPMSEQETAAIAAAAADLERALQPKEKQA